MDIDVADLNFEATAEAESATFEKDDAELDNKIEIAADEAAVAEGFEIGRNPNFAQCTSAALADLDGHSRIAQYAFSIPIASSQVTAHFPLSAL